MEYVADSYVGLPKNSGNFNIKKVFLKKIDTKFDADSLLLKIGLCGKKSRWITKT